MPHLPHTESKLLLGMCQFYWKFLSNLATMIKPMIQVLKKLMIFRWDTNQQTAFNKTNELLQSNQVFVH